ncbi:MAG: UvrD-helicase domain-containing protein, partial [Planctomycetales bacterium]|nr:UvrD-helicase domain-containing protein [Planctomycetales bacterium]
MTFTQGSPLPRATFIRASAGTGKTFQLSNRYLRLLLAGQRPDSILASTFTRKAAGEILERVIQRLARAAASSAEATDLAGHLDAQQVERPEFARLLRDLLRRLDRCRISTLDSYYGQLARTYCL